MGKLLPTEEKDALLCAAASGERSALGAELIRRYHAASPPADKKRRHAKPRTAGALRAAARARAEKRERELAELKEAERRRKEAEQAEARADYLERLAGREEEAWDQIGDLITTTRPNDYDRAVQLLIDLRDFAIRTSEQRTSGLAFARFGKSTQTNPACNAG